MLPRVASHDVQGGDSFKSLALHMCFNNSLLHRHIKKREKTTLLMFWTFAFLRKADTFGVILKKGFFYQH